MLHTIYAKMADEESRDIFKRRLLYSLTGDYGEICKAVAHTGPAREIRRRIESFKGCRPVIWGTGFCGTMVKNSFPDIQWECFVDNDPREGSKDGIPVYPSEKFLENSNGAVIVIATTDWHMEIYRQLLSCRVSEERIIDAGKMILDLFDSQYFDLPFLTHDAHEIFVDAGCYDGMTIKNFIKWSGSRYDEILSFEPDRACYASCKESLKDIRGLTLENAGLWNKADILSFCETGASTSSIVPDGKSKIRTVRLDEIAGDKRVTFIKMDIEGAEKEAIEGGRDIIARCKPKMAVSIYHKKEDIWELPGLLLEMNPEYKFYLRHYSLRDAETVLYAV